MLARAIQSVLDQTFTDWQLLVMDDGSRDPIQVPEDERITLHCFHPTLADRQASVRYATLINWGAEHSESELLSYLTDDDFYYPTRLERMIAKLEEGNDVVYGPQDLFDEDGLPTQSAHWFFRRETAGRLTSAWHRVDHNSVMHTREAFDRVGGWPTDPKYWTEADGQFWNRLTDAGYVFVPVDGTEPTDAKTYHAGCVDRRVRGGLSPW